MATADIVKVNPAHQPVYAVSQLSEASAEETSKSLQENHDKHHIFFEGKIGLHNHIVHHILTIFALGATPPQITRNYVNNCTYQRPTPQIHKSPVHDLANIDAFTAAEGKKDNYTDFLTFFQSQISNKGWLPVIEEFVFAGDERANRMLRKLGAGVIHSLIHLGFGVEFEQPAIVAEGLAEAAVHEDELSDYFAETERRTSANGTGEGLYGIYKEIRASEKLVKATEFATRLPFGIDVFQKAMPEIAGFAARYRVSEDKVEERMKEVINVDAYLTASTQRPPHYPKLDFFLIHSHNATVLLPSFRRHLKPAHFARLLETQVRTDMLIFASLAFRDVPQPQLEHVLALAPPAGQGKTWEQLFDQANSMDDDGHVAKCLRSLKNVEVFAGMQNKFEEPLKKEQVLPVTQVWMKGTVGETNSFGTGKLWTRGAGFSQAWDGFPDVEQELEKKGRNM